MIWCQRRHVMWGSSAEMWSDWYPTVVAVRLFDQLAACVADVSGANRWEGGRVVQDRPRDDETLPKSKPILYYPTPLQPIDPNISSRCCWEANGREPKVCIVRNDD